MITTRIEKFDWEMIARDLDRQGWGVLPKFMAVDECDAISGMYGDFPAFRSHVVMARHGFGKGEYRYFSYLLPEIVQELRVELYAKLAPMANAWHCRMGLDARFLATHAQFLERCHAAGQRRPTPLLLQYGPSDYNCLHQDIYGEHIFPLQVATLLSEPNEAFAGGEFVLMEQRPRMQPRAAVVPVAKGDAVVFTVNSRPQRGSKGDYRVTMRHGVSEVRSGHRHTVGIIFHDAT